jgi:O-antigen/teichoic acid export membrane protein
MTFTWFNAASVNQWLYNARDPESADMIRILLLCLLPMGIIHIYGTLLTATGHIQVFLRISGFFALLNIIANLIFIPRFGAHGAAWVAVITQTCFAGSVYFASRLKTGMKILIRDVLIYLLIGVVAYMVLK